MAGIGISPFFPCFGTLRGVVSKRKGGGGAGREGRGCRRWCLLRGPMPR